MGWPDPSQGKDWWGGGGRKTDRYIGNKTFFVALSRNSSAVLTCIHLKILKTDHHMTMFTWHSAMLCCWPEITFVINFAHVGPNACVRANFYSQLMTSPGV